MSLQDIVIANEGGASKRDIFISRGEQLELKTPNLKSFSVGNKSVLSTKYYKSHRRILIKGKSIGFSDIVIWGPNGKSTYNIYVTSKKEQLNKYQAINGFKEIKLKATPINDNFYIEGELKTIKDYIIYKSLIKDSKAISSVTLSNKLKKKLLEEIYLELDHELHFLVCNIKLTDLLCVVNFEDLDNQKLITISKKLFIQLQSNNEIKRNENYKVTLHIYKIEKNKQYSNSLGAYKLEGELNDLLNESSNLYHSNKVLLKNDYLFAKTIASPSLTLSLDEMNSIELGAETPFVTSNQFGQNTQWKFAGLRMQIKLFESNGRLGINLENEMTSPREQNISGNKIKSTFFVDINHKINIFKINVSHRNNTKEALPILEEVPILKDLFTHNVFKKGDVEIQGFLKVEKDNEI